MLTDSAFGWIKYILYKPEGAMSELSYPVAHLLASGGAIVEQRVFDRRTDEPAAE